MKKAIGRKQGYVGLVSGACFADVGIGGSLA